MLKITKEMNQLASNNSFEEYVKEENIAILNLDSCSQPYVKIQEGAWHCPCNLRPNTQWWCR